jgi:hypothetical protein
MVHFLSAGTPLNLSVVANVSYYWFETPLRRMFRRPPGGGLEVQPLPQSAKS